MTQKIPSLGPRSPGAVPEHLINGCRAAEERVIGGETGLAAVMARAEMVSRSSAPVLLFGETGTGKEIIARAIHEHSSFRSGPFRRVNCGAISPELIDSELFGHEQGAFTGATTRRKGWFEQANGGTLFLDEIGELAPAAQVRLLRVVQDGEVVRVGGERPVQVDVRIVAATHRDLPAMVEAQTFREDLYYRLSVFPIVIPPLRDRPKTFARSQSISPIAQPTGSVSGRCRSRMKTYACSRSIAGLATCARWRRSWTARFSSDRDERSTLPRRWARARAARRGCPGAGVSLDEPGYARH